jgi:low temperature requirement protein LtrA
MAHGSWWAWIGGTFYNARFETRDISYRLFVYLHILPVAAMAVFAHDALGETSTQFALAYEAVRLVVPGMDRMSGTGRQHPARPRRDRCRSARPIAQDRSRTAV